MRRLAAVLVPAVLAAVPGPAVADASATAAQCAGPAPGGEWPVFGQDLRNSRAQPGEHTINASNASSLEPHFIFNTEEHGAGVVHATPVIADGCIYFGTGAAPPRGQPPEEATNSAWMHALNAESGDVVWQRKLDVNDPGLLCSGINGSTPVVGGRVFAVVSQSGRPYAVALDQQTGEVLWRSVIDETPQVYNCGGPVVFDGLVLAPFTGDQTGPANRGGYAIFNAETGEQLAKQYTIPDDDFEAGYKGGGIWTTPAVDAERKYAYAGTANPDAGSPEHPRTNSIVKIDLHRGRETFGQIVASYKGNPDRYVQGLEETPFPCDPDHRLSPYIRSVLCAQMDLDFGASPNLFEGPDGGLRVGAAQKSGVFHVANADSMERVWTTIISPPVFYGNGSTAATDGESLFVAPSPPGHIFRLDADTGGYRWLMPLLDAIHYQAVTYANGLVFVNDAKGFLHVFAADTGVLVALRSIGADTGKLFYAEESSGSTAVARNTVYTAASNFLVAYRPRP
ncbi:MAG: PQQ-binding-like beta-propeller repeat protein [Thermoleophilaceae bacterium]